MGMGCHTRKRDTRGGTAGLRRWRQTRGHTTRKWEVALEHVQCTRTRRDRGEEGRGRPTKIMYGNAIMTASYANLKIDLK